MTIKEYAEYIKNLIKRGSANKAYVATRMQYAMVHNKPYTSNGKHTK